MNFKRGNKIVLSARGKLVYGEAGYPELLERGVYGIIRRINSVNPKIIYVGWYNASKTCTNKSFGLYRNEIEPFKLKSHNHPLTTIFADKMPKRLTKKKKRGKVKVC